MKHGLKALALALALSVGGSAFAADAPAGGAGTETKKPAGRGAGVRGKVSSVDGNTIKVTGRQNAESSVTVDDKTKITLDGADAKLADIKAGMFLSATPATGTATEVKVMTKMPERKPRPEAPKPDAPKAPEAPAK